MNNECVTQVNTSAFYNGRLMAVVVGFHCDVISCGEARGVARQPTGTQSSRAAL